MNREKASARTSSNKTKMNVHMDGSVNDVSGKRKTKNKKKNASTPTKTKHEQEVEAVGSDGNNNNDTDDDVVVPAPTLFQRILQSWSYEDRFMEMTLRAESRQIAKSEAWAGRRSSTNRFQRGWNSVGGWYKFLWFATVGVVALGKLYFDTEDFVWMSMFWIVVFQLVNVCYFNVCYLGLGRYQGNIRSAGEIEARLHRCVATRPTVVLNVRAGSTDDKGNTNYSVDRDFEVTVRTWEDGTKGLAAAIETLYEQPWTKVRVRKLLRIDRNLHLYRCQLYDEHKGIGNTCEVAANMSIYDLEDPSWDDKDSHDEEILCRRDPGTPVPLAYRPAVKLLAYLLVLPALPYRIWFGSSTGKVRVLIQKSITTPPLDELRHL